MNKVTVETKETKKERTYKIGMIGMVMGATYIVTVFDGARIVLVNLGRGTRFDDPVEVATLMSITQEEMDRIVPGFTPLEPGSVVKIEVGE